MLEKWFDDPSKIGATLLLISAVIAFARGLVVPRWTFDLFIQQADTALKRAIDDCQQHKDMNERLLRQNERALSAGEATAEVASRAIQKRERS